MIRNCTPHDLNIVAREGMVTIPPSGIVPRCEQSEVEIGQIVLDDCIIPITAQKFGEVIDLPEQEDGVYLVVSRLVAAACPDRNDLLIPGPLVRDEAGKVVGCKGLSKLA